MRNAWFLLSAACGGLVFAESPYTLEDCRRLVRENDPDVAVARAELESSQQARKGAFTNYLPQVSATGALLAGADPIASASIPTMEIPTVSTATYQPSGNELYIPGQKVSSGRTLNYIGMTVQQTLFAGGRVVNGNRLAVLGEDVSRDKLVMAERDAVGKVEDAYWDLLALQGKRRTLDAYDTLLGALQVQAGDAVKHGLSSRNDLLKVNLRRSQVRVQRMQLESGIRLSARDLRRRMGLPEDTSIVLADTLARPAEDPSALSGKRDQALSRRPEAKLLSRGVKAEELQLSMERGAMLPSLVLGATAFRRQVGDADASKNAMLFGLLSVPVSDLWQKSYSVGSHRAALREAEVKEASVRRQIALGVDRDWDDLTRAWQSCQVAEEAVAQTGENLTEESDRYQNGLSTFSDLLDAQALRQNAQTDRLDSWRDYWKARGAYLRSVGASSQE